MAYQTTVEGHNGRDEAPAAVFARNFSDCARDIVSLAELHGQLLSLDIKQTVRQAAAPTVLLVLGLALLMAMLPVLLMAVAYAFIEGLGWPHWAGFLLAAGIGLLVGGGLAAVAYVLYRSSLTGLERTRKELADNLRWLKDSLSTSGRLRHYSQCQ